MKLLRRAGPVYRSWLRGVDVDGALSARGAVRVAVEVPPGRPERHRAWSVDAERLAAAAIDAGRQGQAELVDLLVARFDVDADRVRGRERRALPVAGADRRARRHPGRTPEGRGRPGLRLPRLGRISARPRPPQAPRECGASPVPLNHLHNPIRGHAGPPRCLECELPRGRVVVEHTHLVLRHDDRARDWCTAEPSIVSCSAAARARPSISSMPTPSAGRYDSTR